MTKRILTLVLALLLTVSLLPGAVLADDAAADGSDGQSVTISLNTLIRKKLISSVPFEKLPQTKFTLTFIGGRSILPSDPAEGITLPQMPGARLKWVISPDVTAEITADSMTGSDGGYTAEVPFLFTGSDLGEGYSLHNGYLTVTEVGLYEFYVKETADGVEDMSYCETDYKVVFEIVQDAQTGKLSVRDRSLAYTYKEDGDEKSGELAGEETSSGIYVVDSTWRIENTYTGAGSKPDAPIDLILAGISEDTGMLNREDHFAYIVGYPDGAIHPNGQITRAEAMAMINRMLERTPESASDLLGDMNRWTDNMDTSMWYYLDVQEATNSHAYAAGPFGGERWYQMLADPDWSGYKR